MSTLRSLSTLCPLNDNCSYPSKFVDCADYEDSTGNLGRHRNICEPADSAKAQLIETYAARATYSHARLRYFIAMWCSRRHRPHQIVEDPEFHQILTMLFNKVKIPSRFTVSRDIQSVTDFVKGRVITMFQASFLSFFPSP